VLERLDAYCLFYGVGRGRAISHLLQGALPDPSWLPQRPVFLEEPSDGTEACTGTPAGTTSESDPSLPSASDQTAPLMQSSADANRPPPLFQSGDCISNNSGRRHGVIAEEPCLWAEPVPLPNGGQRPGHWTYAVAWDGQMGLTIRYAEDLLRPQEQDRQVG
jgi:hypothetical protein